jgi:hypothetical protein
VTPQIRRARQVAACFVNAVRPRIEGMVSRYEAEFMPWSFGEAVQGMGVATVLVEAGGWCGSDPTPMVELHFDGLLAALQAIATEGYRDVDPGGYDSLPGPNESKRFDCVIAGGHIFDESRGQLFRADLGVNHSQGQRLARQPTADGKIVDIGDLGLSPGKVTIEAPGSLILPGGISVLSDWHPGSPLEPGRIDALLAAGTTTAIVVVDINDRDAVESLTSRKNLPFNRGFVARLDPKTPLPGSQLIEHIGFAISRGVLAVIGDQLDESSSRFLRWFGVPLVRREEFPPRPATTPTYEELAKGNSKLHQLLGLDSHRGGVRRDFFADLQLFDLDSNVDLPGRVDWRRLKHVVVAGETVWVDGKRTGSSPGKFLRRRTENCPC